MAAKNSNIWNAFLRIYIGLFFLYAAHFKLNPAFFAGLHNKLAYYANHDPLWFYGIFLSRVAVPNAFLFAILIVMGELFAGIFLTAGFITRIAAFVAIFLNLNYLFAMYWISPSELGVNLTFIICELVIIFTDSGKTFGIDALF
ncbi:MAG: DoxX family membrane protein [Deltaproteobacteria bacterium]|jgi:thiosulfate dehydrogenase [quinone] large subunit|nr:DoxX family membrane protein [Deltaproteobacteria bacterium]